MILGDKAKLEAKGADAKEDGGGGGGGVIAISYTEGFVGEEPTASHSTKGGEGTVPGDNGMVVINGMVLLGMAYQTQGTVFYQYFQTLRSYFKKRGVAEFFLTTSNCLDT